jgi:hypothetical protein
MNPVIHKNEWIQDADFYWDSIKLLKEYREDVISDKEQCETGSLGEFDRLMAIELKEAEDILTERIEELITGIS